MDDVKNDRLKSPEADPGLDDREEGRQDDDRADEQDLNQGMDTGTHDSIHRGVRWGPADRIKKSKLATDGKS